MSVIVTMTLDHCDDVTMTIVLIETIKGVNDCRSLLDFGFLKQNVILCGEKISTTH